MKLSKFDLCAGWEEVAYPFPRTLAETLFPGVEFAIVHAGPETDPTDLVTALPEGWHLDFATGARKKGDFVLSTTGKVSAAFWATAEEAVAYGPNLLTPCWAFPAEIARALREAEAPQVERVAIVGLGYNDYKDDLARFDGSAFTVKFALRPLGGKLRTAALVDGGCWALCPPRPLCARASGRYRSGAMERWSTRRRRECQPLPIRKVEPLGSPRARPLLPVT